MSNVSSSTDTAGTDSEDDGPRQPQWLKTAAAELRDLLSGQVIPSSSLTELASALERYLSGQAPSLEAAFGLSAARGAPVTMAKQHRDIAKHIIDMKDSGATWETIEGALGVDAAQLRRIYKRYGAEVLCELVASEVGRRLEKRTAIKRWHRDRQTKRRLAEMLTAMTIKLGPK